MISKIFPFLLFVFIGIGLTLFFKILKRKEGPNSSFGTENQIFLILYVFMFVVGLLCHLFTFSLIDPGSKYLALVGAVISGSFLFLFFMSARLYGVKGGPAIYAPSDKKLTKRKKPMKWHEKVLLAYVVLWIFLEIFNVCIPNYPGQTLISINRIRDQQLGWRVFSLIIAGWSYVGIEKMRENQRPT